MSLFEIYLLVKLTSFVTLLAVGAATFGLIAFIFLMWGTLVEDMTKITKWVKLFSITAIFLGTTATVFPTSKEAYMIFGGYYLTNNAQAQQLPENILEATNTFLKEYSQEFKDTAKAAAKSGVEEVKKQVKETINGN